MTARSVCVPNREKLRWRRQSISMARICAVAIALVAAVLEPRPAQAEDDGGTALFVKAGRELFLAHCSPCHGVDGRGDGPVAASLRVRPADLTTITQRHGGQFPVADLARTIDGRSVVAAHGSREMPVWGRRFGQGVTPESTADEIARGDISVLIDYLRTIQRGDGSVDLRQPGRRRWAVSARNRVARRSPLRGDSCPRSVDR